MNTKAQTMFMIGIALLVMGGILAYISLSSTPTYDYSTTVTQSTVVTTQLQSSITKQTEEKVSVISEPININTATVEELMCIDGMGETRASAIIEYREYIGGYSSVEQIKDIKGIGDGIYAKLAPYLTV